MDLTVEEYMPEPDRATIGEIVEEANRLERESIRAEAEGRLEDAQKLVEYAIDLYRRVVDSAPPAEVREAILETIAALEARATR